MVGVGKDGGGKLHCRFERYVRSSSSIGDHKDEEIRVMYKYNLYSVLSCNLS
jgi:hypothetical protein